MYSKHLPYTVAHTIFKSWVISFTSQVFWMKIHSKLDKFRIKKLECYIVSDLRFLLEIKAILPETSPLISAQMAVLSCFFQMLIHIYNFDRKETANLSQASPNILPQIFLTKKMTITKAFGQNQRVSVA